jgi:hypothetical protein
MTDTMILRLLDETCVLLRKIPWHQESHHLLPSYYALLQAARANHPDDAFLNSAFPGPPAGEPDQGISPLELAILFTQLKIVLEAQQTEGGPGPERPREEASAVGVDIYREMYRAGEKGEA